MNKNISLIMLKHELAPPETTVISARQERRGRRCLLSLIIFSLLLLLPLNCTQGIAAAPTQYSITDLGPLSNGSVSKLTIPFVPQTHLTLNGKSVTALAINSGQQVAGTAPASSGEIHAALWAGGTLSDLGTLGGDLSFAYGLNDNGQVCGCAYVVPGHTLRHAFLWQQGAAGTGTMKDLGTLGGNNSTALAINNSTEIAGFSYIPGGDYHAFSWQSGVMKDLGTLGGQYSTARCLNASGQIAGSSLTSNGEQHAFLFSKGNLQDLYPLSSTYSDALSINAAGQVVGMAELPTGARHAYLSVSGKTTDLNTLTPSGTGWVLQEARTITDEGQIAGAGLLNGEPHAFLLTPPVADVTSALTITRSGFRYNAGTQQYVQQVVLKNTSGQAIAGSLSLVVSRLSPKASLVNLSGVTTNAPAPGSPFLTAVMNTELLAPGQSVTLTLQFRDPTNSPITYSTFVVAGPGVR